MKKKNYKLKRLKSKFTFSEQVCKRFHDTRYYVAYSEDIRKYVFRELQKQKLSTPKTGVVTKILKKYKKLGETEIQKANLTLRSIFMKNASAMVKGQEPPKHQHIMELVASIPLLVQAYTKIRKNRGAMTAAAGLSAKEWNKLNKKQQIYLNKIFKAPDGMSLKILFETSELLKKGKYPWGSSRRIYIPKPGDKVKKRPLTIPPFMDRIVQQVIRNILESIYEPWFDKTNRSFGFRPSKGTHDAITALANPLTQSMTYAIEGDIEGAYDNVNKDKLVNILNKRITDRTFLKFIKLRLEYNFFDTKEKIYITPTLGIPQGGIDSPYLFNIYMKEFDDWITNHLKEFTEKEKNSKIKKPVVPLNTLHNRLRMKARRLKKLISEYQTSENTNKNINDFEYRISRRYKKIKDVLQGIPTEDIKKRITYIIIRKHRKIRHKLRGMPSFDENRTKSKFMYVRYADDWIILTNRNKGTCLKLKAEIKDWLIENLDAKLSEEKTKVTDINKSHANFLGFEIYGKKQRKIAKKSITHYYKNKKGIRIKRVITKLAKTAGSSIQLRPDKQRLINRFHMKHYCDKYGRPREIPALSTLEPFVIIERFNAVLRGLTNFYKDLIYIKEFLNRWIYILRWSCLKTLAQKYKTSLKKLIRKYQDRDKKIRILYGKTVVFKVQIKYTDNKIYQKSWRLLTWKELTKRNEEKYTAENMSKKVELKKRFFDFENLRGELTLNNYLQLYETSKNAHVKDSDYMEAITYVNWRTIASFDMPCSLCGQIEDVEMHHVRHVRKRKYSLIPQHETWTKIMALRNRKQIPVCRKCHINLIHAGKYRKPTPLKEFVPKIFSGNILIPDPNKKSKRLNTNLYVQLHSPKTLVDNRILTVETAINKNRNPDMNYSKTLEEKGWKVIQKKEKEKELLY
jgi:retron-type reverse transcriptase